MYHQPFLQIQTDFPLFQLYHQWVNFEIFCQSINNKELLDPIIAEIIQKLKSNPNQRYQDLKENLIISDATLSKKMNLLKNYEIIEASSTNYRTGRNFVVYSLTNIGAKMEKALNSYLENAVKA